MATNTTPVHFGVVLPQFDASFAQAREVALAADESGLDSVWVVDHLISVLNEAESVLEAWTEITAIGAITRRVRLGQMVLCMSFRHPPLLAKMAATLDQVTGGRLILGLGAGWHPGEYAQYGYEYPPMGTRLRQLDEACHVLRRLWTDERATFEGRHFCVRDALCDPKPVQPRLPLMIGGGGEKVMLRVVARHADVWNNLGVYHAEAAHKHAVLVGHCRAIGRDPAEILVTQQTLAAIAMDRTDARRRGEKLLADFGFLDAAPDLALTGTPDDIRDRVERNRALGINGFVMSFGRRTDPEHVRLFAREVAAAYR
jgi:F420-dependent oxidoreductase-like protein